jgi:hypothetical protein
MGGRIVIYIAKRMSMRYELQKMKKKEEKFPESSLTYMAWATTMHIKAIDDGESEFIMLVSPNK